jgi:tetratricopeptide (TPR) repeat protein
MVDSSAAGETPREDRQPARGRKTRRLLNVRLLVGTLIALAILAPAAWWWRSLQVRRTAGALLERADDLAEDEDFAAASSYLLRYLELYPNDADVKVRLAQTFDRSVKGPRGKASVVQRYQEALGVASPEQKPELRRRLAELLLEMGRFSSAMEEAGELDSTDPQGRRLLALARFAWFLSGDPAATRAGGTPMGEDLEVAMELNPGDPRLATALAEVYRQHLELLSDEEQALSTAERGQLADKVIDDMVSAKPKDPKVYLERYRYRLRYKLPQREDDLQQALHFGPDDLEVLLFAAAHFLREAVRNEDSELYADARARYEHAIEVAPKDDQA